METKEYKIESHIPIPSRNPKLPFEKMKIGDSFLYKEHNRKNVSNISVHMVQNGKIFKMKFTQMKTKENMIRVWRIE